MMPNKYPGNGLYVVQGEVSALMSAMRKVHWSARSYQEDANNPLLKNLSELKNSLNQIQDLKEIELMTFLGPFLEVIKSNETSVSVTVLALSSVNKFISYGLINGMPEKYLLPVIENIANTVANANFIPPDILMKIVEVCRTLVMSPLGVQLSNDSICNIMLRCFKICFETQINELVRHSAEHCLKDVVQFLFSRLPDFIQTPADRCSGQNKKMRIRSKPDDLNQKEKKKLSATRVTNNRNPVKIPKNEDHNETASSKNKEQRMESIEINANETHKIYTSENHVTNDGNNETENDRLISSEHSDSQNESIEFKREPSPTPDGVQSENCITARSETDVKSVGSSPISSPQTSSPVEETASKQYVNSQGVRFMSDDMNSEDWLLAEYIPLEPHNSICVQELLRFLTVICNPYDKQNTDVMIHTGLSLLTVALEVGADAISRHPTLLSIVRDTLCRNLLSLMHKEKMSIFTAALHVSFLLFESMRCHLKFQLEYFLKRLTDIIVADTSKVSYDKRELALECLVQLWRVPGLVTELFINYDCDLYCSNLYEDITKLLSKNVYPVADIYSTHLLSLNALLTIVDMIEKHCHSQVTADISKFASDSNKGIPETGLTTEGKASIVSTQIAVCNIPSHEQLITIKRKKELLSQGTEKFNEKPKNGIQFLQENGLLSTPLEAAEVVTFLRENPHLDKKQIGDYISHRSNLQILEHFVMSFDFAGTRIDEALRVYLETFRLPGESALISLVLQCFSDHWLKLNGDPFSSDAAFVLAYAIIMLNVDQHNQVVRRQHTPMTFEDFKKNLKGTDDGKDFDEDMLEDIYQAIKNQEIIMPAEQTGLVRENYLWEVMLRRGSGKDGLYIQAKEGVYDRELFAICWGPVVTALRYMFDRAADSIIPHKSIIDGFRKCATISAYYGMSNEFDKLTLYLCKFTMLVNHIENPESFCVTFGMNKKARLAARTVFELVHRHGDILHEGWYCIFSCIFQLFRCKLLPKFLVEAEDFLELSGKVSLIREDISSQKTIESGLLSSLYSYITLAGDSSQRMNTTEEQEFIKIAKDCIAECEPEKLISESKFLRVESLRELLKVLIRACYNADNVLVLKTKQDEDKIVFFLELLLKVVIHNRDRINSLWSMVQDHLHMLLMTAALSEQQFLVERCVIGLLRLAKSLTRRDDEISSEVLQSLRMLLLLKWNVIFSVSRQISYGLYELLKTGAANIHSETDWAIIFTLFEVVGAGAPLPKLSSSVEENLTILSGEKSSEDAVDVNNTEGLGYGKQYRADPKSNLNQYVSPASSATGSNHVMQDGDDGNHFSQFNGNIELLPHDPFALVKCCESLAFLVRDVAHITPFNFRNCVHTMRTFVEATLYSGEKKNRKQDANAFSRVRSKNKISTLKKSKSSSQKSQNGTYEGDESDAEEYPDSYFQVPLQLLDLMHTLHTKTAHIHNGWTKENTEQEISSLWPEGWCPLLQGIARLCCDPRKTVRWDAINYLQRALLMHDLQKLRANEWESCFNQVLFPLLEKLAEPIQDGLGLEETRTRAATLLSKVFLHHLSPLQLLPNFTNLWLKILDVMNCYMHLDKNSELLNEAIQESIKNMILVMVSAKLFFDDDGQSQFWKLTWERVDKFIPDLRAELFRNHSHVHDREPQISSANSLESPPNESRDPKENRSNSATVIPDESLGDVSAVKRSVPIFPHMGQLVSTPIGPPAQKCESVRPVESTMPVDNISNPGMTQMSSLIASAPEFLASLPSFRAHSPPCSITAQSRSVPLPGYPLSEPNLSYRSYSLSTSPDRVYAPSVSATTNATFVDSNSFSYSIQRAPGARENFAESKIESFPHLSSVNASPSKDAESVKSIIIDESSATLSSPSHRVAEMNVENVEPLAPDVSGDLNSRPTAGITSASETVCVRHVDGQSVERSSDPQSPIKISFPVYSGFAQLNNDTIGNIEENNAKHFFYQNRYRIDM